jgi:hypothetical protein
MEMAESRCCAARDQSKRPAHRYSASSLYAVLLHTSRSDRTAWTVRMNVAAAQGGVLLMPRPAVDSRCLLLGGWTGRRWRSRARWSVGPNCDLGLLTTVSGWAGGVVMARSGGGVGLDSRRR